MARDAETRDRLLPVKDERGEAEKMGASRFRVGFERAGRFHRIGIEVGEPRVDQFKERRFRQAETGDRIEESTGDGIGPGARLGLSIKRVPPPLEPDFAEQGLGDDLPHARDFETESIEGMNVPPYRLRDKKTGEPAVAI